MMGIYTRELPEPVQSKPRKSPNPTTLYLTQMRILMRTQYKAGLLKLRNLKMILLQLRKFWTSGLAV